MKKTIAILLAAVLLTGLLTGCHGSVSRSEFTVPESFDDTRDYEITFWAKNDTNVAQTRIYEKAISDFEALYPNVSVNMRLYTDYGRIYNDVITNIATDTTPNVCITYPDHIATYMTGKNVVAPLDGLMADPKYGFGGSELRYDGPERDEIIPEFLEEGKLSDSYFAVPFMRSTEACYVNKTYVEKLGYTLPETLTWDFVWEVSEAAMEKNADGTFKVNGQTVLIPFIYKSTDNLTISMLKQLDAPYSTEAGDILLFNDTVSDLLATFAEHAKSGAFSTFKISGYPANFLNAGQCIFAVDSTAGATWMGSQAPLSDISPDKYVDFETEVMTIPQFDPAKPAMISQGPSVCVFNKSDPQEVLAGWLFAQYLLTNDVQIAYSETEGYVPVTSKARETEEYRDYLDREGEDNSEHYDVKLRATKLLLENTENTFVTPVFNGSASLRDAAGQLVEEVTKSVRRKKTVDDAYISQLYRDTAALYHLNQGETAALSSSKTELGPLPSTAKLLLISLAVCWLLLGFFWLRRRKKEKAQKIS